VARYVVDVMPKREILDPQGKAVLGALGRLGFADVAEVRQGKRFEVVLDGDADDERLEDVRRMAETLFANPVIEDFSVRPADPDTGSDAGSGEGSPADETVGDDA
jgi:phosphoribosylformylglycinamidine synthase